MNLRNCALLVLILISVSRCASTGHTTLLGEGIGIVLGAGVGAIANAGPRGNGRAQNIFLGTAIGGALGSVLGFFAHDKFKHEEKEKSELSSKAPASNLPQDGDAHPSPVLVPPKVETRYLEDQIRGNTFVPGHFEYRIVEPSQWGK